MTDLSKVIENDSWGLFWSPTTGYGLVTPKPSETMMSEVIPDEALALTTLMIRLQREQGFMEENRDIFTQGRLPAE